ncbi:MAG: DNA mismatch repair endonuclease MutL [Oscillospiraceae bacterium]|nr:DNA mismatch repair endonuclease MutL [Oscillospiraceae bacterium]
MPKIIQLDPHLANLIAAGEVVERPASVLKELVENAIDAGAKSITVELQNGGMTFLRVSDDGCGMSREDAKTAFLRHATSKIRCGADLEAIGTLGFRGEALAATAAVSRVELLTRTAEDLEGSHLQLEGGKLLSCEAAGCPVGTTIVVRDLFFNTPARMKFMKRDSVEGSAAASALQKQALAHPEIAFRLLKDGESQLQTPGDGELLSAIYAVLGRQAALEMVPVESKWEALGLKGYVSKPTATRGTRSNQIFFVNHRYIRSKTITAALEEAYRNQLMTGRFPSCVLEISMPLSAVDVNVHPAKTEVKFLNERELFDCVHYGVLGALNRTPGQVPFVLGKKAELPQQTGRKEAEAASSAPPRAESRGIPSASAERNERFFKAMTAEEYRKLAKPAPRSISRQDYEQLAAVLQSAPPPAPSQALQEAVKTGSLHSPVQRPTLQETAPASAPNTEPLCRDKQCLSADSAEAPVEESASPAPNPEAPCRDKPCLPSDPAEAPAAPEAPEPEQLSLEGVEAAPKFRYLGEAFRTYILVEQGENLILIDKHAAHERINFERLLAQGTRILGQTLLQPQTRRFDREEAALLLEHRELLLSLGYDLDDLGEGDLLLRQIPSDIRESDAAATLSEIAEHLRDGRVDSPQRLRDEALHSIACKAAIKAGYITDPVELQRLAAEVLSREDLKYCPHGRPICTVISKRQIEKQFKRIV